MVLLESQYYWLDVRMNQVMKQANGTMPYFLASNDSQWEQSHSWGRSYSDSLKAQLSHALRYALEPLLPLVRALLAALR